MAVLEGGVDCPPVDWFMAGGFRASLAFSFASPIDLVYHRPNGRLLSKDYALISTSIQSP